MRSIGVLFTICSTLLQPVLGAKILCVFPVPTRSHHIIGSSLSLELARRGHEVTMISPFPMKKVVKNYHDINLEDLDANTQDLRHRMFETYSNRSMIDAIKDFLHYSEIIVTAVYESKGVKNLLSSKETFDLIILDLFTNEALYGLSHRLKAPVVSFCTTYHNIYVDQMTGNVAPYSFVPYMMLPYTDNMSFAERLVNTLVSTMVKVIVDLTTLPQQEKIYKNYVADGPPLIDLVRNVSMVLLNSHVAIESPRPFLPNIVQVGGMHVKPPEKLPVDLQKFLDEAEHGAIYFSFGSNVQSSKLGKEKIDIFFKVLSKLPQRVLWKWEEDSTVIQHKNIMTKKWLPQKDILAHKNVKLFITHGGLLSTIEAIYRGVPILGIPFLGDQFLNMQNAVRDGYGLMLDHSKITEIQFEKSLKQILLDSKYKSKMLEKSRIMQDQPTAPMERAIYWTEYVLRHNGAAHLRSPARNLSFFQYFLLDVVGCLSALILAVVAVIYILVRKLCCKAKGIRSQKVKKH